MRSAAKLPIYPLDAVLRVVFRVSKKIVKFAPAKRLHFAVLAATFHAVKVVANAGGQRLPSVFMDGCGLLRETLPFTPVRQAIGMAKVCCALPKLRMIQKCD